MNQAQFHPIFGISISHTYFEDAVAKGMMIRPDPTTHELLQRFGMKWVQNTNEFSMFVSLESDKITLLNELITTNDQPYFEFDLIALDSEFTGYTDLSLDTLHSFEYTSNSETNEENEDSTLLIPTRTSVANSAVFGTIQIWFHSITTDDGAISTFKIHFEARQTVWNYYIINRSMMDLHNLVIKNKDGFQFEEPKSVVLANGQQALMFSSGDTVFPLSNRPNQHFSLYGSIKINTLSESPFMHQKNILDPLPSPNPMSFEVLEQEGMKRVVSPMYIYL